MGEQVHVLHLLCVWACFVSRTANVVDRRHVEYSAYQQPHSLAHVTMKLRQISFVNRSTLQAEDLNQKLNCLAVAVVPQVLLQWFQSQEH